MIKNVWLITLFTLREAMARKVFLFFAGISLIALLGLILVFSVVGIDTFVDIANQSGSKGVIREVVNSIQLIIINPLAGLCLLLAIFSSASFVPSMMEKGNIDLLLSKPISRDQLLLGKYFGGILVVFLNILFLVIGIWIIVSLKFAYWNYSFLYVSITITFAFAVLYSIIVLLGVATRGSILGMMIAYFIFILLSPLLYAYFVEFKSVIENDVLKAFLDGLYYIVPKTSELTGIITINLAAGKGVTEYQPVLTSLIFLILAIGFSIYLFRKKDF
ncbi:MAG: ABC transporter permease [Ignavibacteria bacterium]|nr:ABC transporter permease [Ignavibacteria bacterium]MBT8383186.1 ABC transporter permease [Ignavibacteria bacterium]MBT8392527.1 ABC transporter permease [Ignavibacteria bacterium]NNJ52468.1 ABC transporter permease subunit [Ignavibacteriaceae bacterium]NNL21733.1 ABC transporter permease subunit [Ignavibacteriaceae bacterium]